MDFTLEELENLVPKKFQAKQIYGWIYQKYITDFQEMSNISKELRQELSEKYYISSMEIINRQVASDGTIKYLFRLQDGRSVETVLIKMRDEKIDKNGDILQQARWTICLSTQVGCKVGCSFCLTAKGGFVRDLTAGEIVEQVVAIKRDINLEHNRKTNIVYMGMGEPLDNLDNLVQAIKIIANQNGLSISPKRQTVSTSGIAPKIDKLGILGLGVNIAISLHAVDDEVRNELIPMNRAFNIQSIIEAIKRYPYDTRKRVMFEYLMIKGINDSLKDAKKLIKLLQGIKAKINLIYFNPYPGSIYERPNEEDMEKFASYLNSKGLLATIRASRGMDISAACGQLREQHVRISQSS